MTLKYRELKRRYEVDGAERTVSHLSEALRDGHLKPEEFSLRDMLIRYGKRALRDPQLVYLALDEPSMDILHNASADEIAASPALTMMSQGWPWPRDFHGRTPTFTKAI